MLGVQAEAVQEARADRRRWWRGLEVGDKAAVGGVVVGEDLGQGEGAA
jgi:hypothetical protein